MDKMLAPDFVAHSKLLPGQQPDREGYKQAVAELTAAFSNQRFLIEDQVAQGDKVMTRLTVRQTHDRGELLGAAPTVAIAELLQQVSKVICWSLLTRFERIRLFRRRVAHRAG